MGLFGKKDHPVIEVRYFDRATGKVLARSMMSAEKLPASFEASTTAHMRDQDWSIFEARPMTAAEFRRSGKLVLVLARTEKGFADPSTILFSMPTITNDAVLAVAPGTSKLGASVIEIHEDDWRQIEWLPLPLPRCAEARLLPRAKQLDEPRFRRGSICRHNHKLLPATHRRQHTMPASPSSPPARLMHVIAHSRSRPRMKPARQLPDRSLRLRRIRQNPPWRNALEHSRRRPIHAIQTKLIGG